MNYEEFWNLQVKPLWNAYKSGVIIWKQFPF
jgi:hypothetical protein